MRSVGLLNSFRSELGINEDLRKKLFLKMLSLKEFKALFSLFKETVESAQGKIFFQECVDSLKV